MDTIDPATGQKLPADAIVRVLFIANTVHIYNIPPLASTKGHTASTWTTDPSRHIFSARLRILETSYEKAGHDFVKVDVLLEDPSSGQLFAAAPYTAPSVVESALDSSRFFAIRVQDPSGRKAMLGAGFEERSEAFDFSVALQDARKSLGIDITGAGASAKEKEKAAAAAEAEKKRDYSLKAGETITINLGGKMGKRTVRAVNGGQTTTASSGGLSGFSLPPPPGPALSSSSSSSSFLPPPPSASHVREREKQAAKDLGFDDGEFDEFA
ncbi:hypothetical protein TD95_001127 [Thielaviopsis punctulata]|uniref:NECAP PHear domain-containing protein n=1 Tax=Thielaviopsis punctulata TaxID=72032 RepID=A0A0F4ZB73_9PEZI|nr:hypothetical protein TD95_001127 [Thielaviopsis punctulata]